MQLTTCVLVTLQFLHVSTDDYVQSSDPDDPVLQEALAAEGEGWRLTKDSTECTRSDEHLSFHNCSEAIQTYGGCVAEGDEFYVNRMLVFCRSHGGFGDFLFAA